MHRRVHRSARRVNRHRQGASNMPGASRKRLVFDHARAIALLTVLVAMLTLPMIADAGLNRWTSGGPEGAIVSALVADPRTTGVLYAGTPFGGVFKTATRGTMWARLDSQLFAQAFAIDPNTPSTV